MMQLGKVQNLTRRSNGERCQHFLVKLKICWQAFQGSFAQDNNVLSWILFFFKVVCLIIDEKQKADLLKYSSSAMNQKGKQTLQETVQC